MPRAVTLVLAGLVPSLLGAGTFATRAHAHASPHGLQLVWQSADASALPLILANRGLIALNVANQDGPDSLYSVRCNEAYNVNTSAFPVALIDDQGALVLATTEAVSATADRGCSWADGTGLPDISLGGFTQDRSTPNRLLVTTQIYDKPAQIFQSLDYGRSWTVLATNAQYSIYTQLLSQPDGQHIFAAGQHYDLAKKNLFPLWASSTDGGKTWVDELLTTTRLPLGLHPGDSKIVFAFEPGPTDSVDPKDTLVRSEDGGKTFTAVAQFAPITAFTSTPDGATMWLGTSFGGLLKSTDLGKSFVQIDPAEITGITCLDYRNDQLWVCANFAPNTNGVWYSADKGESYTQVVDFVDVTTKVSCSAQEEQICRQPWIDWMYEQSTGFTMDAGVPDDAGLIDTNDAGVPTVTSPHDSGAHDASLPSDAEVRDAAAPSSRKADSGCSTSASTSGSSWLLLAGLLLLRKRKQRR